MSGHEADRNSNALAPSGAGARCIYADSVPTSRRPSRECPCKPGPRFGACRDGEIHTSIFHQPLNRRLQGARPSDEQPLCVELFAGLHERPAAFADAGDRAGCFDIADMSRFCGQPKPAGRDMVLQERGAASRWTPPAMPRRCHSPP